MKLALLIQSSSYEKLHLMASMAATAVSLSGEVSIFLMYGALRRYVTGTMDDAEPAIDDPDINRQYADAVRQGHVPSIHELLDQAKAMGKVKIFGCSQSIMLLHTTPEQQERLDGVVGFATFMVAAADAKLVVI